MYFCPIFTHEIIHLSKFIAITVHNLKATTALFLSFFHNDEDNKKNYINKLTLLYL